MTTYFNEMYDGDTVRAPYARLGDWTVFDARRPQAGKQAEAEAQLFRRIGITFAVYGEGGDPDRLIPFDMFPRLHQQRMGQAGAWHQAAGAGAECVSGRCLWPGRDRARGPHSGQAGLSE